MEEKVHEVRSSFRSIFNIWNFNNLFPGRSVNPKNLGFTLIELLVAIAVMGVLLASAVILIDPQAHLAKSRDARRKSDLKQIQAALELYRADRGFYLPRIAAPYKVDNCGGRFVDNCASPDVVYLQSVPKDPRAIGNGGHYFYCTNTEPDCNAPADGYRIYSCLENINDEDPNKVVPFGVVPPFGVNVGVLGCPAGSFFYYAENP